MENITGKAVTHKNYLKNRLFLVKELKQLLKNHSVIVEAPRRFGKTSVIKELIRQESAKKEEKRTFNLLFLELEGEETINAFCLRLFSALLELYRFRKKFNDLSKYLGDFWNVFASRFKKIGIPGIELELQEKTRNYNLTEWKGKIEPLILDLDSFEKKTVIIFDEFPDMLRRGDHDLNHYHARLERYLGEKEKECVDIILKQLCTGAAHEKAIYDSLPLEKYTYEIFQSVVDRLIYEGYITMDIKDNSKLRFVAHILKDWWACKKGIDNVCI